MVLKTAIQLKTCSLKKKKSLIVFICKPCLCSDPTKHWTPQVKGILTSLGFSGNSCSVCSVRNWKRGILNRVQKCLWSSLMATLTTLSTRSPFLRASTALSSRSCGNMSIFAIIIQTNKCLIFVAEKNVKTLNPFISTPADQPDDWNITGLWSTVILKTSSWYFFYVFRVINPSIFRLISCYPIVFLILSFGQQNCYITLHVGAS